MLLVWCVICAVITTLIAERVKRAEAERRADTMRSWLEEHKAKLEQIKAEMREIGG